MSKQLLADCDLYKCKRSLNQADIYKVGGNMKINYDNETSKWFRNHIGTQTTVCNCKKCGLFYKPSLGHKCKKVSGVNE